MKLIVRESQEHTRQQQKVDECQGEDAGGKLHNFGATPGFSMR